MINFDFIYKANLFLQVKTGYSLPVPLKNHFYKGKRLSFKKRWFCLNCNLSFNLPEKNMPLIDIVCSHCSSNNVTSGTAVSKALIDGKSVAEIRKIIDRNNKIWEKIENARRNNSNFSQEEK